MTSVAPTQRINSIDLVRGIVCVLMAIDHVRVYSGVPAGGPDPSVFLTRWITHFVAPAFAFFAGTGAYLLGKKLNDMKALSKFLWTRGLILVALELTVIREMWTFNFDYKHYMLAGVIWMLGWCMVLMAFLVRFSPRALGIFGVVVIMGQGAMRLVTRVVPGPVGAFLYDGGWIQIGEGGIGVLYVLVPWIGVMALGYAFGTIMLLPGDMRRRRCLAYGGAATGFFVILGSALAMQSAEGPFWMRLLGQQKYPASALFLAMTLGPTIMLLPTLELVRPRRIWDWLTTFGRVPMFYYLLHIPTIHVAAMIVSKVREGSVNPWLINNFPLAPSDQPPGYQWSLGLLYFVWALCLIALYFPSAWYAKRKATNPSKWMSYI